MTYTLARVVSLSLPIAVAAVAAPPDVATIVQQTKAALEPAKPSIRKLALVIGTKEGETTRWSVAQARKDSAVVSVVLEPEAVRGSALLVKQQSGTTDSQWLYFPAVRRVRQIVPPAKYQAFLGSDFTYADLGFVSRARDCELLGTEETSAGLTYKVQEVPVDRWYYGRIVTWVASDTWLPIKREFYDPSNTLWKLERFEDVKTIDGIPTPMRIRMEERREGGFSEMQVSDVRYGAQVPDSLFDPKGLAEVVTAPVWTPDAAR